MSRLLPLLLALLLLISSLLGLTTSLSSKLSQTLSPLTSPLVKTNLKLNKLKNNLSQLPTLTKKLNDLNRQNQELLVKTKQLESLQQTLAISNQDPHSNYQLAPLKITSLGPTITIISTQLKSIKPGQAFVANNLLLGTVKQVLPHSATIETLTNRQTPLKITTQTNVSGNYQTRNLTPIITNIDSNKPLKLGEAIYTQGSETLPSHLLIGKVKHLLSKPSDPFQTAEIELSSTISQQPENLAIIIDF